MATTSWAIDPTHTEIGFKVKHMMFTNVSGRFDQFSGSIETEGDDFSTAKAAFEAETASINTGNADRDGHLKSPDFFDAENHPKVQFSAGTFEKVSDENFKIHGDLTVHGVTHPIVLDAEYSGLLTDPWGNTKAAFNVTGKFSRKDYGLTWNAALETGGVLVSDEVKLNIEMQLVKQA